MITKKTIEAALGLITGLLNDHQKALGQGMTVNLSLAFDKGNGPDMTDVKATISYWPTEKVKDEAETTVSEKQGDMFEEEA